MRASTWTMLALGVALGGCGSVAIQGGPLPGNDAGATSDSPASDAPSVDRPPSSDVPIHMGRPCTNSSQCGPGLECLGSEGCAVPWTCQPQLGRPCTDDLAPYCGCDGVTIAGSSTCPPGPFLHRGPCDMPPPPVDGGPGGCLLPNDAVCPFNQECRVGECTVCFCASNGELRCTGACVDAGPPPRTCRASSDCPAGYLCAGAEGCDVPWTCRSYADVGGCTADVSPFCGCDGRTFMGSSTCPGQPFAHRGACGIVPPDAGVRYCMIGSVRCQEGVPCRVDACTTCTCSGDTVGCAVEPGCGADGGVDAGGPRVCPPQDARGVGACTAFFGYAWNGADCVGIGGCSCEGTDCRSLYRDPMDCYRAHFECPIPI
ncbi:MAG: hypothetical protein R3A52_18320 [Polyangiales bacterium]